MCQRGKLLSGNSRRCLLVHASVHVFVRAALLPEVAALYEPLAYFRWVAGTICEVVLRDYLLKQYLTVFRCFLKHRVRFGKKTEIMRVVAGVILPYYYKIILGGNFSVEDFAVLNVKVSARKT